MSRLTASKAALLQHCGWWARDDAPQDPYRQSAAADRGTRFHAAIARFTVTGELESYEDDIAGEMAAAIAWLNGLGLDRLRLEPESAFGWDPERAAERRLAEPESAFGWDPAKDEAKRYDVVDRGYPKDGLIHGTADLIVFREGSVEVYDWKTGDGSGAGAQLRLLGLMVARYCGLDEVTVAALEVKASGVTEVCRETLDAFALSALAGDLAEPVAAIPTAEPTPGSHCGELYCPARLGCPLGNAAAAELVDIIPATALIKSAPFRLSDPIKTAEHAAWAVDVIRLVSAKLDAIKEDIRSKVPPEGWALADGRVLKETMSRITYVDKDRAYSLAKELGATEQQLDDCKKSFDRSNGLRVTGGNTKPRTRRTRAA